MIAVNDTINYPGNMQTPLTDRQTNMLIAILCTLPLITFPLFEVA